MSTRKHRARLLQGTFVSIVALAFLSVGCSATSDRGDYTPSVSDKAHPLSDSDAQTATVFEDRLVFPLSSQDWLAGVAAGDVLVSGYETGFLRLVTSLETTASSIIVHTEDASLTDIVEEGETETTVDYTDLLPASAHAYPGYSPQAMASDPVLFEADLTGKVIPLGDGLNARLTKGVFSFKPSLDVRLGIKGWKLVEARAIASGAFNSDFQIEIEGTAAINTSKEVPIWRSNLFEIPLPPILGVPVACAGELVVKAGFTFDAKGQVHVTLSQTLDFNGSMGFQYDQDGFAGVKSFEPNFASQVPEIGADVEVKATGFLVGAIRLGFYGFSKVSGTGAEVELSAKPSIIYHYASTDPAPGWGLDAALRVDVTPSLKAIHRDLVSKTFTLYDNEATPKTILPTPGSNEPPPIDPGDCTDGQEDGLETAVDCGGKCPAQCGSGQGCATDSDCATGACVNGECTAASCQNGAQDGGETGIDCGGPCPECAGGACVDASDCLGANCVNGACEQPLSCEDGVQGDGETGIDCGGPCAPCGDWPENCYDGAQNGDETGADCGGSCPPCEGGGGGGTCDGTGDCQTCATCAEQGACADVANACAANADCVSLANCFYACADQTCQSDCVATYPAGETDFWAYDSCVTCSECYSDCGGAAVCGP